jgi:hypothetical protein
VRVLGKWTRSRKAVASTVAIALVAGIPVTIAALHPGFPISDVELNSRDVWVTNGEQLLGGRLNRQIDELNGAITAGGPHFDVLQDGDTLFQYDPDAGRVEAVSPATTKTTSAIDVPKSSHVSYGTNTLAIVSSAGDLWTVPTTGDLQFNYTSTAPLAKLGKDGDAIVTQDGTVIAVSPSKKTIYRIEPGAAPVKAPFPAVGKFQLSAVGDHAVLLDQSTNELVKDDGTVYKLGSDRGLRLQQVGAKSDFAVVATGDSLLKVDLGSGSVDRVSAKIDTAVTSAKGVSAPVFLDGCIHGAWAAAQRYLVSCAGSAAKTQDIQQPTDGDTLEFRVNKSVIALNNLNNGNVWLVDQNMQLVENWEQVTPPQEDDGKEGDEKSTEQSFEDTIAERTPQNRPPIARPDSYGARPGKTTILPVLDNDTDPDGDVLVISNTDPVSEASGRLDHIDGGRALQFTPAPGYVGTVAFSYTVDDGRGGTASAGVTVNVRPGDVNEVPVQNRKAGVTVEANQSVTYNVLADWNDPDGDDITLVGASPKSGDLVRFTPDGFITFTHQTAEIGKKQVQYQVSDGRGDPQIGTFDIDVKAAGSLNPIGTPDFASTFVNESVVIKPLSNDQSPSGAPLSIQGIEDAGGGSSATFNQDQGTVTFSAPKPGQYYVKYTVAADAKHSVGLIRIDVAENPKKDLPPIAVKDIAYLRGDQPTTVSVLANDVSPGGKILAVQSVDVPQALRAKGLVVEILESTLIRVTSPAALTDQVQFSYTISDGQNTSTATVSVVPVAALTKHQPPVAAPDAVKVRAGDIVSVDVLKNDFHPDDVPMSVDPVLVSQPTAGLAFVNGDRVRYQAPKTAGQYQAAYRVKDQFGETATATVTFTVTAKDKKANQDPVPVPLVARVLAGGKIHVDIPLNSVDPDGDSVQLLKFPQQPALGVIKEQDASSFDYEASRTSSGTDTFSYQVVDADGATGIAQIKIAVVPRPATNQPPNPSPDSVQVRPGRLAQVDLTANDSDPQGSPIKVSKKLIDVPKGIKAEVVDKQYLVLTAPSTPQAFSLRYTLTNDLGGSTPSYVQVQVTPNAPILPPTAKDYTVKTEDIAGKKSIDVDLFPKYAFNPAGRTSDLKVTFEGANADAAAVVAGKPGRVTVSPGPTRQAIAYRVTNTADKVSAMAFIIVPPATGTEFRDPPRIDPSLPTQYVSMNETRSWDLKDILTVPTKRPVMITDKSTVSAVQSNGAPVYVDNHTLKFTPAKDYRGPAAILFTVTDGASKDDPKGNTAALRLNIVVGDPEFRDTPPEFTAPTVNLEPGESQTIDLRASTQHPNPSILQQITYSGITGAPASMSQSLSGSQLQLSVPRNAKKNSSYTLGVTLRWDKFTVQGTISVNVVKSSKPLAVANPDNDEGKRNGGAVTIAPLANDSNPFQSTGEPLKIIDAEVRDAGSGATVTHTDDRVTIKPGNAIKNGTITVVYTVRDATEDSDRDVKGYITFLITDVPAKIVPAPTVVSGGDRSATFRFTDAGTNGKAITGYEVRTVPAVGSYPSCAPGTDCAISNLTNGTAYRFQVVARNVNGVAEEWSDLSPAVTPYGTPDKVQNVRVTSVSNNGHITSTISWAWNAVDAKGGGATYYWSVNGGAVTATTGTTASQSFGAVGTYSITVYAQNAGGKKGDTSAPSPGTTLNDPPPPPPPAAQARRDGWPNTSSCNTWSCSWPAISWSNIVPGTYDLCFTNVGNDGHSGCDTLAIGASGSHRFSGQYRGWPPNTLTVTISRGAETFATDTNSWGGSPCLDTGNGCRNG